MTIDYWFFIWCFVFGAVIRAYYDHRRHRALQNRAAAFDLWWRNTGSRLAPKPGEDNEAYVRRVVADAWDGGFAQRDQA